MASDEIKFGPFQLNLRQRVVLREDKPVRLGRRALDILCELASAEGNIVSKDKLIARLWAGQIVEEGNIPVHVYALRKALDDQGDGHSYVVTVPGRGYRLAGIDGSALREQDCSSPSSVADTFTTPVVQDEPQGRPRSMGVRFVGTVSELSDARQALIPSRVPPLSIVVLPFTNLSNDPEVEYIADGFTDDLTTDLSRHSGSLVVTRKGKPADMKKTGRELGVRYVIEGSVRRTCDPLRLNVRLTDAESGAHLWADRFDADPADLAQAHNEITGRLARTLTLKVLEAEGRRIQRDRALDADPQDLLVYGWALSTRATNPASPQDAQRVFERVLEIEPDSIGAKIGLGYTLACNVANHWSTSVEQDEARADQLLVPAIERDPNNYLARAALGLLRRLQNRLDESRIELEKAIALAPNFAPGFSTLGTTLMLLGEPEAAILKTERALRLSPAGSAVPIEYTMLSQSHLLLGHVEQAIALARRACADNPRLYFARVLLAAALGVKGDLEEARVALAEAIKIKPEFNSLARLRAYIPFGSSKYWALCECTINLGLRRAGMPDE